MSVLLPLRPAFVARIDAARELGRRFLLGAQLPGAPGAPPEEFEGHRPYTPGDDVRWIDWNLFARQEQLYVKVFRAEEEVEVLLLVDASASMTGGRGLKHRTAAAAGAALARLALLNGHPVRVAKYADRIVDLGGPWRSPDDLFPVQRLLAHSPLAGMETDLAQAFDALLTGRQRPVSVVALTDGFQKTPLVSAVARALARGARRMALVRIVDPEDLVPRLRGRVVLRDPEGADRLDLVANRELEDAARLRIAHHFLLLGEELARRGVPLHELRAREPFEQAFLDMLRTAVPAPAPRAA
jgi:uncharacterized protein (DUF58 family)